MSVRTAKAWAGICLALAAVLFAQSWADSMDSGLRSETGAALGRTGFAYLGGLRTFAAAVLWNRLEPQFHTYYDGVALQEQIYLLPTMRAVITLDPTFARAYDLASWILFRNGKPKQAVALLEEGTKVNPDSAKLHSSLSQLLFVEGDIDRAVVEADRALAASWTDEGEKFVGLATLRNVYVKAGVMWRVDSIEKEMERLKRSGVNPDLDEDEDESGPVD